jgi:Tfp pilus assembly protein PilV
MYSARRRSTSGRRAGARGFSLLEALGATSLMAVGLLGLAAGTIGMSRNAKSADSTAAATALAVERMEQLRSLPLGAAEFAPGIYFDPGNPMHADGTLGGIYRRRWTVSEPDTPSMGLQTVTVTVAWEDSGAHETTIAAYVRCSTIPCD